MTSDKIPTRQPELDLAKGFAILFMIWVHVFEEMPPAAEGGLYTLVEILGGPFAAPVFMVCMGIGVDYSRHNTPADLFRRGLHLLGVGFLLNLLRYVLPDLFKFAVTGDSTWLKATFSLFSVDILQFAGLAFLFLALLKKLQLSPWQMLLVGICASLLGMQLSVISTGNDLADQFLGFFVEAGSESYFPFLNWIIFPLFGQIFGIVLQHCPDKKKMYRHFAPVCAGLMLIYLILTLKYGLMFSSGGSYARLSTLDAVFFCILAVLVFSVCFALTGLLPTDAQTTMFRWSKNINTIYCIHWVFLGMLKTAKQLLWPDIVLPFWLGTVIAAVLLLASDNLAKFYKSRL